MLNYLFDLAPVADHLHDALEINEATEQPTEGDREVDKKTDWKKTWDSLS